MSGRRFFQAVLLTILVLSALPVCAQDSDEPNPIKWTMTVQPSRGFAKYA